MPNCSINSGMVSNLGDSERLDGNEVSGREKAIRVGDIQSNSSQNLVS